MEKIWQAAQGLQEELVAIRRDLHKHPETGWTEFRTASFVIKELEKLGYAVTYGADVVDEASMMGVPNNADLEKYMARAISEGADAELVAKMKEGNFNVDAIDALALAEQAGSSKAVNIVLMGRLSKYMDIPEEKWIEAIKKSVAPKFVEMNLKAFALGRNQ